MKQDMKWGWKHLTETVKIQRAAVNGVLKTTIELQKQSQSLGKQTMKSSYLFQQQDTEALFSLTDSTIKAMEKMAEMVDNSYQDLESMLDGNVPETQQPSPPPKQKRASATPSRAKKAEKKEDVTTETTKQAATPAATKRRQTAAAKKKTQPAKRTVKKTTTKQSGSQTK